MSPGVCVCSVCVCMHTCIYVSIIYKRHCEFVRLVRYVLVF